MQPLGGKSSDLGSILRSLHLTKPKELSQKIRQSLDKIKNFHTLIHNATTSGSLLKKTKSLIEIEAKILDTEQLVKVINEEAEDLKAKYREINDELKHLVNKASDLTHPSWGRGRQKYLDNLANKDPSNLSAEATLKKLDHEIKLKENQLKEMEEQIKEFDKIQSFDLTIFPQALKEVQSSLAQLSNITIATQSFKREVPLKNLVESSKYFKNLYESGLKDSDSKQIFLQDLEGVFDQKDIEAFISFIQTGEIILTEENVMPLLHIALKYSTDSLSTKCSEYLKENASWESFPIILEQGIEIGQKELIWIALNLAMKEPKALIEKDFQSDESFKDFSEKTKNILNDFKILANNDHIKFQPKTGEVIIDQYPEELSALNNLSLLMPVSITIQESFSDEWFNSLSKNCPHIAHLSVGQIDPSFTKENLKGFKNLISFGHSSTYKSFNEIEEFRKELFPIEINSLFLNIPDLHDNDLKKIIENCKNLKKLYILNCSKITSVSSLFESLERVVILECASLKNIDFPFVNNFTCMNAPFLKNCNIFQASSVICHKCEALENLNIQNTISASLTDCKLLKNLNAPSLIDLNCIQNESLVSIDAPNAKKINIFGCKEDLKLNVPNDCIIEKQRRRYGLLG